MTRRNGSSSARENYAARSLLNLFEIYFESSSVSLGEIAETIGCTPESLNALIENRLLTLPFESWIALANLLNIPPDEILRSLEDATLEFEQHQRWLAAEAVSQSPFAKCCV